MAKKRKPLPLFGTFNKVCSRGRERMALTEHLNKDPKIFCFNSTTITQLVNTITKLVFLTCLEHLTSLHVLWLSPVCATVSQQECDYQVIGITEGTELLWKHTSYKCLKYFIFFTNLVFNGCLLFTGIDDHVFNSTHILRPI